MIAITEDKQIDRDGEVMAHIVNNVEWLNPKQAPRILSKVLTGAEIDK